MTPQRKIVSLASRISGAAAVRRRPGGARGFTLIEVLCTLMLLAIVLPAISQGISLATSTASASRRRTEAVGLAESKLNELVATGEWQSGQGSGDFSPNWPDYHWQANVSGWQYDNTNAGLQQLDVVVSWSSRNRAESITVSTLTYVRADSGSSTGSSSAASGSGTAGTAK